MADLAELKKRLEPVQQLHLLKFWEKLSEEEKKKLQDDINTVQLEEVVRYYEKAKESLEETTENLDDRMEPVPQENTGSSISASEEELERYRNKGLECISNSEVGVLLMSGGQGTRLGVTYPKGMYKVGLISGKTLFQIQAERIRKLQQIAKEKYRNESIITWYIMTSEHTMDPIKKYFHENNYFGLEKENVFMFEQGKLPCFDFDGKLLLTEKHELAQAPDGNGGLYRALKEKQVIEDMEKRGIKYLHAHSVDNILVQVADPVFIGYCTEKQADCGAKVVKKVDPEEAVGVVCKVDGLFQVVEYSEIRKATRELRYETGDLLYNAGNICNHFFTTDFLRHVAYDTESSLKLHAAKKKIPFINDEGEKIKPTSPNGIKIEKFVFDVFQFTDKFVTWEVRREDEFSALKNSDEAGKDCPKTARKDLYALHKKYVEQNGGIVEGDEIEIPPLVSYAGEGLEFVKGKTYLSGNLVKPDEEKSNS